MTTRGEYSPTADEHCFSCGFRLQPPCAAFSEGVPWGDRGSNLRKGALQGMYSHSAVAGSLWFCAPCPGLLEDNHVLQLRTTEQSQCNASRWQQPPIINSSCNAGCSEVEPSGGRDGLRDGHCGKQVTISVVTPVYYPAFYLCPPPLLSALSPF